MGFVFQTPQTTVIHVTVTLVIQVKRLDEQIQGRWMFIKVPNEIP